jgi:hypothetical protein
LIHGTTKSAQLLVQAFGVICDSTGEIGFDYSLNFAKVGQDRLDSCLLQAIVRTLTHAARQQDLAVADGLEHARMPAFGSRPHAMGVAGFIIRLIGKLLVSGFRACLLLGYCAIGNGEHLVIDRTPETRSPAVCQ